MAHLAATSNRRASTGGSRGGRSQDVAMATIRSAKRRVSRVTAFRAGWGQVMDKRDHIVLEEEAPVSETMANMENEAKLISYKSSRDWWAVLFTTDRVAPNWRPVSDSRILF